MERISDDEIYCKICLKKYQYNDNFVDFLNQQNLDKTSIKSLETWGADLHARGTRNQAHIHLDNFDEERQYIQIFSFFRLLKKCLQLVH